MNRLYILYTLLHAKAFIIGRAGVGRAGASPPSRATGGFFYIYHTVR